jgi:hypothetical protein
MRTQQASMDKWPPFHDERKMQVGVERRTTQLKLLTTPRTSKKVTRTYLDQSIDPCNGGGFTALAIVDWGSYNKTKTYLNLYYKFSTLPCFHSPQDTK